MDRPTKRFKSESQRYYRKRRFKKYLYSQGLGPRKNYYRVPRTMGALFANPEIKYFDTDRSNIDIPAVSATTLTAAPSTEPTGTVGCLFAPSLGDTVSQRNGRKVAIKKIRINGSVQIPAQSNQSVGEEPIVVRVVVYVDKQANGSQAGLVDVFRGVSGGVGPYTIIKQHQSTGQMGRFRVLKDKFYTFDNFNAVGTAASFIQSSILKNFKFNITFKKPLQVNFNDVNDGTVASISSGAIHLQANATINSIIPLAQAYIAYTSRVVFVDV